MFCKKLLIIISIVLFVNTISTYANIDSLINIAETQTGNELTDTYNNISFELLKTDNNKAIVFAQLAIDEGFKNFYYKGLAQAYKSKGNAYYNIGNDELSTKNFKKSRVYYKQLRDYKQLADVDIYIGVNYDKTGDFEQAIRFYQKASVIYEDLKDEKGNSSALHNLGVIYFQRNEYKKAIEYYLSAVKYDEKQNDNVGMAYAYNNIANCYKHLKDYDKAIEYNTLFNKVTAGLNDKVLQAASFSNMANIYEKLNQLDLALKNNIKALNLLRNNNQYKFALLHNNVSIIYRKLQRFDKALQHCDTALQITKKDNFTSLKLNVLKNKSEIFFDKNNFKRAYSLLSKYNYLNDSIKTKKREQSILELETKFDLDKKNKELDILNKEKKIQELKLEESNLIKLSLIISSVLILIIAIVLFSKYRYRIKTGKILSNKNEELEVLNSTKDKFFSIIAHDLKNPLSSFNTISGLLIDNFDNLKKEDIKYYVEELNNSSLGLKELLQNLLQWALSKTDKIGIDKEEFNIQEPINQTISYLQTNSNEKNIIIKSNVESTQVFADKNMIETVIRNLVSNAIKYTPEGGKIDISAKNTEDNLQILVTDSGVGISKENINNLFKIETNASTKGTNSESGSGLGLILCKEFLEKNNGKIWVESEINKGSEFIFTVPFN